MHNETHILRDNIKSFRLLEYVSRTDVVDAVKNHDIIYIYYAGDETVNRGFRTIEPYVIGTSKKNNLVVRAYQQAGATDRGQNPKREADVIPGWRMFKLDGITSIMKTGEKFATEKSKIRPKYNPEDRDMNSIIAAVDPTFSGDIETDGMNSIGQPDIVKRKVSAFDNQEKKFKSLFDASNDNAEEQKKAILGFEEKIKKQKRNPSDYIVINRGDEISIAPAKNSGKYREEEVLGNLDTLFRKFYNPQTFKIDKNFIEKQRKKLFKNTENMGNV